VSEENLRSVNSPSVTGRSGSVSRSRVSGARMRGISGRGVSGARMRGISGRGVSFVVYRGGEHGGG
jgi:hypothetical protein